jgi:hypothetical protein
MGITYDLRLHWFKRADGLYAADCPCGSALVGCEWENRQSHEDWHFSYNKSKDRRHEIAFHPDNTHLLSRFFALSECMWAANRGMPTYGDATRVYAVVQPFMDDIRKELFRGMRGQ